MKLIIDGYGKTIHKKDNQILIKQKGEEIYRISARKVTDITISGKGKISFDAISLISKKDIPVIGINYFGQIEYIITSPNGDITLKKEQYKCSDNQKGAILAKKFILSKLKNQKATLRTLNKNKKIPKVKEKEYAINRSIKDLEKLKLEDSNIKNKIMGIEGKSSAEYWNAISLILPEKINFKNRNQKPINDVVNSALNYGYAILASQITQSIIRKRLDPYCGFLHADRNRRASLTFDIIEEFRQQIVDKTVLKLVNKGKLTENQIDKRNNALNLETRKLLAGNILDKLYSNIHYDNRKLNYLEIIDIQVENIVKFLLYGIEFDAFYLGW
ncbi:MAG: CRISPR-associated endonuclease Cas1 [Methanobrevibacter sp.]|uniref:CRISPR-associated endonuclease Cas1 n=1 Tax=Methanobrevibacter sp. TaxID=66852 RepID=UPI0026DF8A1D|nr:CRISPR-associated endonuclease Cas1 [Methanobrevibacter sp.]MDO5849412.1 CRISPR-associated endonuclease Cas1 [Methanobrevibacter sp.]